MTSTSVPRNTMRILQANVEIVKNHYYYRDRVRHLCLERRESMESERQGCIAARLSESDLNAAVEQRTVSPRICAGSGQLEPR